MPYHFYLFGVSPDSPKAGAECLLATWAQDTPAFPEALALAKRIQATHALNCRQYQVLRVPAGHTPDHLECWKAEFLAGAVSRQLPPGQVPLTLNQVLYRDRDQALKA